MSFHRPLRELSDDQRGVSLVFAAITMAVLLGMCALAIDVGILYTSKAQAQNAADSGALAGAGALLLNDQDAATATVVAEGFGEKHNVFGQVVDIQPATDVAVDLNLQEVTVTVRRTTARGNPVPTFFAKVFGVNYVDVVADATAAVGCATAGSCLKPWMIPDAFDDVNGNGKYDEGDYYEKGVTSWGTDYRSSELDVGAQLVLKYSNPGDAVAPGQFYPIDLPLDGGPITGGDKYRDNIANCNGQTVQVGDLLMTENGNMIGPTKQGIRDLIDQDPGASWVDGTGIVGSAYPPGASPRIARIPMFHPGYPPTPGKQDLEVTNIAGLFIEGISGNGQVTGRLMPSTGAGGGAECITMLKMVRLVE